MWRDVRLAVRSFARQRSFTAVVVATLALGIGGSTAIFSVVNAVLLRDLPYPEPDNLYLLRSVSPDGTPTGNIVPPELRPFSDVAEHPTVQAAALAWSQGVQIVGTDGRSHATTRYGVTDQFFDVFGRQMALGRGFDRGEDPGPVVLAYAIWRDLFNANPDIIGSVVTAEGVPREVVGVARPDFEFPENPGYWYLMRLGPVYDRTRSYRGFVRLRPGRTGSELLAEATRHAAELGADPVTGRRPQLTVQPFLEHVVGDLRSQVLILFGAMGVLLLIACINVTNLLLARATERGREMALREAVGASRWRIIRQLLTESLVLSTVGGLAGLSVAVAGVRILLRMAPPELPRLDAVSMDGTVLIFAVGVTVLTGGLVALAPAWRLANNPLRSLMNEGGRGGPARHRLFSALVVTEIALAVVLVVGAGLLVRSYGNLTATDPGFNAERVLTLFMYVPGRATASMTTDAKGQRQVNGSYAPLAAFLGEVEQRIRAVPGVQAASTTTSLPLDSKQYDALTAFRLDGQAGGTDEATQFARSRTVGPDFFEVMGMRLIAGRVLEATDRPGSPGAAVVDETFVRRFLSGQNPLGRRIRYLENRTVPGQPGFQLSHRIVDDLEIVGVVNDVKYLALAEPAEPSIYMSRDQWTNRRQTVVVRSALENPASLVASIRSEIEALDPLQTADFAVYTSIIRASLAGERLAATLLLAFGVIAVVLASVGIYGLMSYSVAQRTREIAVRSAMGASSGRLLGLVARHGTGLSLGGIALGLAGAVAVRRAIASQLYGVSALDVGTLALASVILFGVAAIACVVPARRAMRIQPAELLRGD